MKKTKPKPKLKLPKKRASRNPYARALATATKKYDKAFSDLERLDTKCAQLRLELPRLEQVVAVLQGYLDGGAIGAAPALRRPPAAGAPLLPELGERKASGPPPKNAMDVVPAHLRHMITEHPSIERGSAGQAHGMVMNVNIDPANEDGFLPDPDGTALIED